MYRNFGEIWTCEWIDKQTDKQSDIQKHTDTLVAILVTRTGGDVIKTPVNQRC